MRRRDDAPNGRGGVAIREEALDHLEAYAHVGAAFEVSRMLEVVPRDGGLGGLAPVERAVSPRYVKDYDATPGHRPADWPERFDLSRWGLLSARREGRAVGGVAIAWATPEVRDLEDRSDLAVLFDLRVAPEARRRGVGAALFASAEAWATVRGCRQLKVETQNVNLPACRLYASQGCTLGAVHRFAYPELPHEVQLLWYKELTPRG